MTQQDERASQRYLTAAQVRLKEFTHRMRGADEAEVREFLDLVADQVRDCRAENDRLRSEVEELRRRPQGADTDEITPQAVTLFSQAQQVADQLVEEAVQHARDLMASARHQQREILQSAHHAAEKAASVSGSVGPDVAVDGYTTPVREIEYVRTFARVAQVQLRSVLDALTEQVEKLGDVPKLEPGQAAEAERGGRMPVQPTGEPEQVIVYPRPQPLGS